MFCSVKMGLNSGAQAQIISVLAREKIEYIQTSNGLCVKASRDQLAKVLEEIKDSFQLETVDSNHKELAPDVRAFIEG